MILTKPRLSVSFERLESESISDLHDVATLAYFQTYFGSYTYIELRPYLEEFFSEEVIKNNLLEGRQEYFLVRYSGKPIGFSYLKHHTGFKNGIRIQDDNSIELSKLYLLQKYTGKGIGTQFMKLMTEHYSKRNISSIYSTTWSLNPKALRFYKKQGFRVIGEIDYEFAGKNNIDLILRKDLNPPSQML